MIQKIIFTAVFLLSFQFLLSAVTETRYYNAGQTKAQVKSVLNEFETAYKNNGKYQVIYLNKVSDDDYTIDYTLSSKGAQTKSVVRYQLFADRLIICILDATFVYENGKIIKLTPNHANNNVVQLYNISKSQFIDDVFKYLKISENKTSRGENNITALSTQVSVTKKYSIGENINNAKDYSKMYFDYVLKLRSTIKYFGDKNSNSYDVEYTQDEPEGTATILMNFKFTPENFTLTLKSVNYYDKASKTSFPLTEDNSVAWRKKSYETVKNFYLDKQAGFMAPAAK
ncbi:hypothetical protein [Halpernia sp.]|uniref:hypothetical protein n=1 Tax=Halpernia sp. TaxID=2782209 RepID=UPI003A8E79F3